VLVRVSHVVGAAVFGYDAVARVLRRSLPPGKLPDQLRFVTHVVTYRLFAPVCSHCASTSRRTPTSAHHPNRSANLNGRGTRSGFREDAKIAVIIYRFSIYASTGMIKRDIRRMHIIKSMFPSTTFVTAPPLFSEEEILHSQTSPS
jgi:hypothetical protein